MAGPRKRVFGPLFYGTVVFALLATAYAWVETAWPAIQERQELRRLAASLKADDPKERQSAAQAFVSMRSKESIPYLIEATHDPRGEVRGLACQTLVRAMMEPETLYPVLAAAAADDLEEVRCEAALGFRRIAQYAGELSRFQTQGPDLLGPSLRARCLVVLIRLLRDPASAVRVAAADALGEFGRDRGSAAALAAATGDEDRAVQIAAARALLTVSGPGDRSAARTLVALVAAPERVGDRAMILELVKRAGDETQTQAIQALAALLSGENRDVGPEVIECLVFAGPRARAALPVLRSLWDDESDDRVLRASAGRAIAAIEGEASPKGTAVLVRLIADATLPQDARMLALERLRDANASALVQATPALVRQLGHTSVGVRRIALELLSQIVETAPAQMPTAALGR